jgi:type IV secretion system protein VirB10
VVGLLSSFAYGGYRRQALAQVAAREAGLPIALGPATASASEVEKDIPVPNASLVKRDPNHLHPPTRSSVSAQPGAPTTAPRPCGFDPRTGQPYRFNPDTGQPGVTDGQGRAGAPQPSQVTRPQSVTAVPEQTPEEQRVVAAYQREHEAMVAPTAISSGVTASSFTSFPGTARASGNDDLARIAALGQAVAGRGGVERMPATSRETSRDNSDYIAQNMQSTKAAFLVSTQQQKADNYLRSTRTAPLSSFEIKAGWEIPAVLEQSLNSDLPGEIKALVMSNVFDTATGRFLLIPQGARLVGKYDSRISYGQDGMQVAWERIIFPDASSVDINGMVGLDSHGNSGLRYDVDHHYKGLFGFAALSSAFSAARSTCLSAIPKPRSPTLPSGIRLPRRSAAR